MAFTNSAPFTIDTVNNNVSFSSTTFLEVLAGTGADGAINRNAVFFNGTTAYNASPFAGIQFGVNMASGGGLTGACGIASGKANSTDGDTASFLAFYTRANGASVVEAARFSPNARFLIGATSDNGTDILQINGSFAPSGVINFKSGNQINSQSGQGFAIVTGGSGQPVSISDGVNCTCKISFPGSNWARIATDASSRFLTLGSDNGTDVAWVKSGRFLVGSSTDDGSTPFQVNGAGKVTGALAAGSSSANSLTIAGAAASSAPTITASGSDTNIGVKLVAKGAAPVISSTGWQGKRTTVADTTYNVLASDWVVAYTSLTAPRTVTLFAPASGNIGQQIIIADESGSAGTQTITIASASGSVLGVSTITSNYGQVILYSNGTNWYGK